MDAMVDAGLLPPSVSDKQFRSSFAGAVAMIVQDLVSHGPRDT
jgi:hypothetical protein